MRCALLVLIGLNASCCLAQENLRFKQILRENGSSISTVHNFHHDSHGYLWVATGSDLIRFDGTNFRYYGFADFETPQFRGSRGVLTFEDQQNRLWVGTDVGSLFQYDREHDKFMLANDSMRSPKARIYHMVEAPDGSFWVASLGGGLVRFHPETKMFKQYRVEKGNARSLPDNFVSGLAYDREGVLWVGTTKGLCSYDAKTDGFVTYPLNNINPEDTYRYRVIRNLLMLGDKIYLCTYGGLQIFDRVTKKSQHLIHNPYDKKSISHNSTFSAVESPDGKLWIATYGGGLNLFDPVTKQFTSSRKSDFDVESISSDNLFSVYLDKNGLLWIGAADNTISIHNTHNKKFYTIKSRPDVPDGISSGWARTLFQENDSIFWLGFNGEGLNRLNLNTGKAEKYLHNEADSKSLGHNSVSGISKDSSGKLWISLEGGGLNQFDPVTKRFTRYNQTAGKSAINNSALSALLIDSANMLWTTAYRSGLNIFDIQQEKFKKVDNDSLLEKTGVSLALVEDIFEINGNIWFDCQNQIVVFDKKYNQFVKVATTGGIFQFNNPFSIETNTYSETRMLLIAQDEIRSIIYISPNVIKYETLLKTDLVKDLRSFVVHNNEIWYVTYNQLVRWNLKKNERHIYTQADGIVTGELYYLYKDKQGRVLVMSNDGISWFYPDQIINDTLSRKIVFTDFKLFNRSAKQELDSVYQFSISSQPSQLKTVTLNHNHRFFSISFAAQEFVAPEKIQYAYRLSGFDKDWVYVGNRTFASYTNLDPGQYTFEVKATNPDGFWNKKSAILTLMIHPPFWRTWWFIGLVLVVIGGLLYVLHRYYLTQSLKLERLRTKIASDLHDELGSTLTRISLYSDLLQDDLKEKNSYLKSISNLSREVVGTMSDIIWAVDNRNDSFEDLIIRMKEFASSMLEAKNIESEFLVDHILEKKIIDPGTKQNLYLIFKESINNIIKHAEATHVSIRISNNENGFVMRIHDNGRGINGNGNEKGNGMRSMTKRAEGLGAQFQILNGVGTTVMISRKKI